MLLYVHRNHEGVLLNVHRNHEAYLGTGRKGGGGMELMVECCFTSTETIGLIGMGAQDGHLDFHTAPELCMEVVQCCFTSTETINGGGGKREIIYLLIHCHHQNDFCIKMGGDESHLNLSLG